MKNTALFTTLLSCFALTATSAPAGKRGEGVSVPFCASTLSQLSKDEDKMNRLKYAQDAATHYYPYLSGALQELTSLYHGAKVCSRILVIGKNEAFHGLAKLKYFIRFEVTAGSKMIAAIPIFMVNTSEQGHMNPSERQWMSLDPAKVRTAISNLVEKHRPTVEITNAPDITGPEFVSFIHSQPIGRTMLAAENSLVMPLGSTQDGEYFLLTGFHELRGMYESRVTSKAMLFLKTTDGKLKVSDEVDAYRDIMAALSDARKTPPAADDLDAQIRATLRGTKQTEMLP